MLTHRKSAKLASLAVVWLLLLGQMPPAAAQPLRQDIEPTTLDLTFLDLGYTDQVLRASGAFTEYSLYMPQNFQLGDESYVEVIFSYSIIGGVIPAELKVSLNDIPLGGDSFLQEKSLEGSDEDGVAPSSEETLARSNTRRIRLSLGKTALKTGHNRLEITLDTNETCGFYEPQVEVIIYAISYFHLVYDTPPLMPDLQVYPYPFYEYTFRPSQVYVVLPREPSAADLSAAATVSAGLGRLAESEKRLTITSSLDIALTPQIRDNHNLIVIGQPGRNRLLGQLPLPLDELSREIEPDDGVLQILPSPWNLARAILVVTGQSELALYRASAALHRPSFLPGLHGQASIVKELLPPPLAPSTRLIIDRTFDQLGYEDKTLYGIVARQVRYDFYLPHAWEMLEPARLFLSFSHSPLIDPANSTLDVYLNDIPIGGTLLDQTNQTKGLLAVEIPNWLLKPGKNRLYIQVEMHFFEEYCIDNNDPRAWTVIFKNSYLHLPLVAVHEGPEQAVFPSPFDGEGHYEETVFVVSDRMTAGQRDALLRLAAYLGASSENQYLALRVLRASELSEEIQAQKHLIIVGRPSRNPLFQEQAIAKALPQPFEAGTDILIPRHDTVVVQQMPDWSIGLLQTFPSPWNPERRILAVTGTTDESVAWSLQALTSSSRELAGNLIVVGVDGVLYTLNVHEASAQQMPPVEAGVVRVGEDTEWWLTLAEKWWR